MDKSLTMPPSFSSASTTHRLFCFRFLLSYEKYLKNLGPDHVDEMDEKNEKIFEEDEKKTPNGTNGENGEGALEDKQVIS